MIAQLLTLVAALGVPKVSVTAPAGEAEQLEATVRLTTPHGVEIVRSDADIEISRDPDGVTVRVLGPEGEELSARHVPVEGELAEVALQEVAEIVAEAAASYSQPQTQRPKGLAPPEPTPTPEPQPEIAPKPTESPSLEPEPEPKPAPEPEPRPSFTNANGRAGYISPAIGLGVSVPAAAASLGTGFSLGMLSDLTSRSGRQRTSRIHASFALRFSSQSIFSDPQDLHLLNFGGRLRLGGVKLNNFTYAAAEATASWGFLRPECVDDQCDVFGVGIAGSFAIGSQWLVLPQQSFGLEAGVALPPVTIFALVVYTIYFGGFA